jgi:hypothetical protein
MIVFQANQKNDKNLKAFSLLSKMLKNDTARVLNYFGKKIVDDIIKKSRESKTGFHYASLPNRSSAVGETSREQSGKKNRATHFNSSMNKLIVGVEADLKYGEVIEKTRHDIQSGVNSHLQGIRNELCKYYQNTFNDLKND